MSARAAATVIISSALYCGHAGLPAVASTFSSSHLPNVSRSRAIVVPGDVVVVVALGVVLRVGRMRPVRHVRHVRHGPGGKHDGAGPGVEGVDDLFDGHHGSFGGKDRLLLHPGDPPQLHVACPVRPLRVDDRDVRVERRDGGQQLAGERAGDRPDRRGLADEACPVVAAQHRERQPARARHVPVRHPGVAVLLDLERARPAVLDRVPEPVQRAHPGIAAPGEDQLAHAARADQLVVNQVRRHPDHGEVPASLPYHLVPGRERDQVGEPLHRDDVAVVYRPPYSLRERDDLRHIPLPSLRFQQLYPPWPSSAHSFA